LKDLAFYDHNLIARGGTDFRMSFMVISWAFPPWLVDPEGNL